MRRSCRTDTGAGQHGTGVNRQKLGQSSALWALLLFIVLVVLFAGRISGPHFWIFTGAVFVVLGMVVGVYRTVTSKRDGTKPPQNESDCG